MKNKKKLIIVGIFTLIILTISVSYALYTYSRLGTTKITITSGDIEFSFFENNSVSLADAFPISDEIGASDTANIYTFYVSFNSSVEKFYQLYTVSLLTDNNGTDHFNNNEIKFNLEKNDKFVIGSNTSGLLVSSIDGFDELTYNGEGIVLDNQQIAKGNTDTYKLRIWIDENVNYSGDIDSNGTMTGTKNNYTYSLKVKVTSGIQTEPIIPEIGEINVSTDTATMTLTDEIGISAYAITNSENPPEDDSTEWIYVNSDGTIKQMSANSNKVVNITYKSEHFGKHYIHVKNILGQVSLKSFDIERIYSNDWFTEEEIKNLGRSIDEDDIQTKNQFSSKTTTTSTSAISAANNYSCSNRANCSRNTCVYGPTFSERKINSVAGSCRFANVNASAASSISCSVDGYSTTSGWVTIQSRSGTRQTYSTAELYPNGANSYTSHLFTQLRTCWSMSDQNEIYLSTNANSWTIDEDWTTYSDCPNNSCPSSSTNYAVRTRFLYKYVVNKIC